MQPESDEAFGVGGTEDLTLRVSVGILVKVLFENPEDGRTMLALERTATLREIEGRPEVIVKAKPFGGGARLRNPQALEGLIGHFHYDSEQSYKERDFRILIHRASWVKVKDICLKHFKNKGKGILDTSPERELAEEFKDTLHVDITPNQYHLKSLGMIVEDLPRATDNVRAPGLPTVRIYYLFEARIRARDIIEMMLTNSERYTDSDLQEMAREDARQGGEGRANGILLLTLDDLKNIYQSIPADRRGGAIRVGKHQLDGNVPAIVGEVEESKYLVYFGQS